MKEPARFPSAIGRGWARNLKRVAYSVLFAVAVPLLAAPAPLRSPWDDKIIKATDTPYSCSPLPNIPADLVADGFYRKDDPTSSIVDPVRMEAYKKAADPVKAAGLEIVKAADAYRSTGSRQAAQCVMSRISTMATDNSLNGRMSSNQAYYVQGWVVGAVAIAYLKVRDTGYATTEEAKTISLWLHGVGEQTKGYYEAHRIAGHGDAQNNHLYWAGLELAAIGVATNDRVDFDWAMATYDNGVGQIRHDGTLPREMARGSKALHYNLYALAPLVLLAEFGKANNIDLYAHSDGSIHRLVRASIAGLIDASAFEKPAGVKQEVPRVIDGAQIGWAPPYVRRFPNSELTRLLTAAPDLSNYYLGGLPPD
jgi:poly(beta-D-mannuronate) lyase